MRTEIRDLVEISRFYGTDKEFVIAGGGNTSFKDDKNIWIKASGTSLATLDENDLVELDREKLKVISTGHYPEDPLKREEEVKNDLFRSITDRQSSRRPSVETSLHDLIQYRFVVHLHPTLINGVLCSRNARTVIGRLFGDRALFIPYTDPGYTLFKAVESEMAHYRSKLHKDPGIIFLENHGCFVSADTTEEIRRTYEQIVKTISAEMKPREEITPLPYNKVLHEVIPAVRMLLSEKRPMVVRYRHNSLIAPYYRSHLEFHKISMALTPDMIVYCKAAFIYIENSSSPERIMESFRHQLPRFAAEYGYPPRIIVIRNAGIVAIEETTGSADTLLDVYEDLIKTVDLASAWGGAKYLTPTQAAFIDQWEVENYRRKVSKATVTDDRYSNRIAVVTGGAKGFGAGIAEALFNKNLNVVIADLDEDEGNRLASSLSEVKQSNKVVYTKTDVSDPESVKNLIINTVHQFGGLDIMISNAGILRAGSLEEMDPETFSLTTDVNYRGYFICAKYASEVMKIQNREKPDYYTDIIQINSKSGLRGSNRNFAYSGSKFGGIGLTQSFALELAPFRIKVNSVCPGNYYEGPLWSDPKNGLFVQYLRTGKVPGAKSIEDVRRFYEDQVPMKRGCRLEDVVKALLYIVDQEYETGQALPVTGGQVMLS